LDLESCSSRKLDFCLAQSTVPFFLSQNLVFQPVEQPKKFEFIINLKAAKQIGVTIPPEVLAQASRLIK